LALSVINAGNISTTDQSTSQHVDLADGDSSHTDESMHTV